MDNKIVVIMSVYKNDKLCELKESIESLINQTYKDFDIFIQCDGLLSNELNMYLDEQLSKKNITLLRKRRENKGLAYSLNELIDIALDKDYEYLVRMDADDICREDRIEIQFNFMEENNHIDVCGSDIIEFYDDGTEKRINYPPNHTNIKEAFSKKLLFLMLQHFLEKYFLLRLGNII